MKKPKLLLLCLDALCDIDIEYMKTLPNFGWILSNGALVEKVFPVYPSLTYPCHVSIMTGNYPNRHGIPHNEILKAGVSDAPWYRYRNLVKSKYLLDYAKERGFTTCSLNWPLTGGADFDLNMPMIVPFGYTGDDSYSFYENYSSKELLDRYFWKYSWLQTEMRQSLDLYTMALALDVLRDFGQPDVMLVKLCDLDSVRHESGVDTDGAKRQLKTHDAQLGVIRESIRRFGDHDNTHFVVLGDHGQTDVERVLNFNYILRERGLLTLSENGSLLDFDAYCHSAGMSGWIELKDPCDAALKEKVYNILLEIKDNPKYCIDHVLTKEEADKHYGLTGPFEFIVESESAISFGYTPSDALFINAQPGDYKTAVATHGGLPSRAHQTTFFACGPNVKKGVVLPQGRLVDEAPTMARMLGFDMPDTDGKVMEELLK